MSKSMRGLKTWWNTYAKPSYRVRCSAARFYEVFEDDFKRKGSVLMRPFYANDHKAHRFKGMQRRRNEKSVC